MSFTVTYNQASFTASGGYIQAVPLMQAVQNTPAITTTIEAVNLQDPGSAAAEVAPPVAQIWAFQFAGAGPLSGPEVTALNGVVAAYTSAAYVKPALVNLAAQFNLSGLGGKGLRVNAGGTGIDTFAPVTSFTGLSDGFALAGLGLKPLRVNAAGTGLEPYTAAGGGNVSTAGLGSTANKVVISTGIAGTDVASTPVSIDPATGNASAFGTIAATGMLSVALAGGVGNPVLSLSTAGGAAQVSVGTVGFPATINGATGDIAIGSGELSYGGGTSPSLHMRWNGASAAGPWSPVLAGRPVLINAINAFALSWSSTTQITIAFGDVVTSDASGRAKVVSGGPFTISTGTSGALGIDTGAIAANKWYNVYIIAKHTTGSTGQDVSVVISLSATAPTLPSGYTFYRRIGVIRTANGSATLLKFFQHGSSNRRDYYYDSLTEFAALTNGSSTVAVSLGYSGGSGTLPISADNVTVEMTTNGTSACRIRPNSNVSVTLIECPISRTKQIYQFPCTAGVFQYINPIASGASTIAVQWFSETL